MPSREEWEKNPRPETILVTYNHETQKSVPMIFGGGGSFQRAIKFRDEHKLVDLNCSFGLIANEAAEIEYQNYILDIIDSEHKVSTDPDI